MTKEKTKFTSALEKATGEIKYNTTNDYMFRALFQQNIIALKGLLSSLLQSGDAGGEPP